MSNLTGLGNAPFQSRYFTRQSLTSLGNAYPVFDDLFFEDGLEYRFPYTGILDNFNRADGGVGSGWTADPYGFGSSGLNIASNQARSTGASYQESYRSGTTYGPYCEAYLTIPVVGGNGHEIAIGLRLTSIGTASVDGYYVLITFATGTDTVQIYRIDNQAGTLLGATINNEFSAGDKFGVVISSSTITVLRKKASGGNWYVLGTRTDSTYTAAGYLALTIENTTIRVDDFGGGSAPYFAALSLMNNGGLSYAPTVTSSVNAVLASLANVPVSYALDVTASAGNTTVDLSTFSSSMSAYSLTVTASVNAVLALFSNTNASYALTVTPGSVIAVAVFNSSVPAFYALTVQPGSVTAALSIFMNGTLSYTLTVSASVLAALTTFVNNIAGYALAVAPGSVTAALAPLTSSPQFYALAANTSILAALATASSSSISYALVVLGTVNAVLALTVSTPAAFPSSVLSTVVALLDPSQQRAFFYAMDAIPGAVVTVLDMLTNAPATYAVAALAGSITAALSLLMSNLSADALNVLQSGTIVSLAFVSIRGNDYALTISPGAVNAALTATMSQPFVYDLSLTSSLALLLEQSQNAPHSFALGAVAGSVIALMSSFASTVTGFDPNIPDSVTSVELSALTAGGLVYALDAQPHVTALLALTITSPAGYGVVVLSGSISAALDTFEGSSSFYDIIAAIVVLTAHPDNVFIPTVQRTFTPELERVFVARLPQRTFAPDSPQRAFSPKPNRIFKPER